MMEDPGTRDGWRNRLAWRIANFALNHIATPWYRDNIAGAIRYGLDASIRDVREGREAPPFYLLETEDYLLQAEEKHNER